MKKIYPLLIIMAGLNGCISSSKLLQQDRYDAAIERAVKNIRKNPANTEEILVLEKAFAIATERSIERINYLNLENNPRNLEELIALYSQMKTRQSLIRTVLPLQLLDRTINYPYVNYDEEIVAARNAAAGYYYENALRLMEQNNKDAYRQAYDEFIKVKTYSNSFREVDRMIQQAKYNGISRVLVMVKNHTPVTFQHDFEERMLTIEPEALDSEWVQYHFLDLDESTQFDYYVVVNFRNIDISADISNDKDRIIKKKVPDGFEYVLDNKGNVKKDTLGNDLKVPKYKELTCVVIETLQQKHCRLDGDLEFIALKPNRFLKKEPVGVANTFEHKSGRAIGDLEALDDQTRKLTEMKPVPFPNDYEMILSSAEGMRIDISQAIRKNRNLIK